MFAGKAEAYPSESSFRCSLHSMVGSWPYPQTLGYAGKGLAGTSTSLLRTFVNYVCKSFITLDNRTTIEDDFVSVYCVSLPWIGTSLFMAPKSTLDDGVLNLVKTYLHVRFCCPLSHFSAIWTRIILVKSWLKFTYCTKCVWLSFWIIFLPFFNCDAEFIIPLNWTMKLVV